MIPNQAIEKAIAGGWKNEGKYCANFDMHESRKDYCEFLVALDPTFWQGLGKVLGWNGFIPRKGEEGKILPANEWQLYAFEFYDLILTGGDTEKFWSELLGGLVEGVDQV